MLHYRFQGGAVREGRGSGRPTCAHGLDRLQRPASTPRKTEQCRRTRPSDHDIHVNEGQTHGLEHVVQTGLVDDLIFALLPLTPRILSLVAQPNSIDRARSNDPQRDAGALLCGFQGADGLEESLGAGSDRFFGYGAAGAGVGLLAVGVPDALADEERIGLDLKLVSGAQMVVWRDLFLGAAASFDLAFYGGRRGAAALPGEPTHFRTERLRFRLIGRRHSYALWNPRARRSSSLISCMSRSRNLSAATIAPETHSQGLPATVRLGPFGGESLSFDSTPIF